MSPSEFDLLFVPIACTRCGHATTVTIAWVKANELLRCNGCGGVVPYERAGYLEALGGKPVPRSPG